MKRLFKNTLPLILLAIMLASAFSTQAKTTKKKNRTVYYIVCGSYDSLDNAIKFCNEMSEVVFYLVYETKADGKIKYRVCCDCTATMSKAKKQLAFFKDFLGSDDLWIWSSKGLAKCVYRPEAPIGDGSRIPILQPK